MWWGLIRVPRIRHGGGVYQKLRLWLEANRIIASNVSDSVVLWSSSHGQCLRGPRLSMCSSKSRFVLLPIAA